jgi:outer membrane protein assembly factor BamB
MHGIRLAGEGDMTATQRIWKREIAAPFSSTSVVAGGRLYSVSERGEITCVATSSGELKWSGKLPKHATAYYASPLLADGKLYCIREDGTVFVVRADGTFEVLAEIALGERMIASPVPTANRLLLRGEKNLLCVGTYSANTLEKGKSIQ